MEPRKPACELESLEASWRFYFRWPFVGPATPILYERYSFKIILSSTSTPFRTRSDSDLSVYLNSLTTGYEATYERYKQLRYKGLKNNVVEFAEMSEF